MIGNFLLIPIVISFFMTFFLLPFWIRKTREIGLVWEDMNKINSGNVSGSGGIIVLFGFVVGVLIFTAGSVFFSANSPETLVKILALTSSVLILSLIGFIDDLFGWRKGGLTRKSRIVLVFFAAIPLVAINAGKSSMLLPILGEVDLGIIYPLLLIPVGIIGAATTFNFLAGFNGLEAGNGILIISALSLVSYLSGSTWLAIAGLCMVASLLAFLIFNFYPAKIFPGDSLTYSVGGLIAMMAILGDFEKLAVFFFIPVIIEFFLKVRGGLVKQSFGEPQAEGSLKLKYEKIYSLNHLAIYLMKRANIRPTEMKVTLSVWLLQILVIVGGFSIAGRNLF